MRITIIAAAFLAALSLAACTTPEPKPLPSPAPDAATAHAPGLEKHADGTADAWGYVVRQQLEGGFWALATPGTPGATPGKIVVVLLPGSAPESAIAALSGTYAHAAGTVAGGASIRMSGPEMTVGSIEPATAVK